MLLMDHTNFDLCHRASYSLSSMYCLREMCDKVGPGSRIWRCCRRALSAGENVAKCEVHSLIVVPRKQHDFTTLKGTV